MADQNLREMMIDDIQDDEDDDTHTIDNQHKIKWYLIDTERTFCKVWDFLITCITIYNLVVTPLIMVFPQIYTACLDIKDEDYVPIGLDVQAYYNHSKEVCASGNYGAVTMAQKNLKNIELAIDIIYSIEILFCFVKRTLSRRDIQTISINYLRSYFVFDVIATLPNMIFFNEGRTFYWLKFFRFVHVYRLPIPLQHLMRCLMSKYSKKRQNDLTSFAILILLVIYINHLSACFWLFLGTLQPCDKVS